MVGWLRAAFAPSLCPLPLDAVPEKWPRFFSSHSVRKKPGLSPPLCAQTQPNPAQPHRLCRPMSQRPAFCGPCLPSAGSEPAYPPVSPAQGQRARRFRQRRLGGPGVSPMIRGTLIRLFLPGLQFDLLHAVRSPSVACWMRPICCVPSQVDVCGVTPVSAVVIR
jgi:hypothetical protein